MYRLGWNEAEVPPKRRLYLLFKHNSLPTRSDSGRGSTKFLRNLGRIYAELQMK
jgi:hypothetical protein